jgi:hypothetical protein
MDIVEKLENLIVEPYQQGIIDAAVSEIEQLRETIETVIAYWNEWKDAPDDDSTALSLEEVVWICKQSL